MSYNILIFGGTTEGVKTAQLLDALAEPYIYSTKTQTKQQVGGEVITGAMTASELTELISTRHIKLIIDAAHPFAENLHKMVIDVCTQQEVSTIRYQRTYPSLQDENIHTFSSYETMQDEALAQDYQNILALTGVQTITKMKKLWTKNVLFRILATQKSLDLAKQSGINLDEIHQEEPSASVDNILNLAETIKAQVILSKESGTSGYFESKVIAARQLGIPLFVITRPQLTGYTHEVCSTRELHQQILRLRKTVLKAKELRSGYTTGSCLTAAAQAAFTSLLTKQPLHHQQVQIACGEEVSFLAYETERTENSASYVVIKDGGDDPDVTHANEIGCTISLKPTSGITFKQGKGVGRVTLPGLQLEVGEPAINPVPRQMIRLMLENLAVNNDYTGGIEITAFVPKGEELAQKTFNPRVGVVGGISIIGTTGKVMPYSSEAFVGAIDKQMRVAHESRCEVLLATSGLRSENRITPLLKEKTYTAVHFGNFVGETLKLCHQHHFPHVVVGIMLGKALKLAEGRLDTHSKHATFSKELVAQVLRETSYTDEVIHECEQIQLANELTTIIPFTVEEPFYVRIAQLCHHYCSQQLPKDTQLSVLLLSANNSDIIRVGADL